MNKNLVKIFFTDLCSRLPYNVYVDRLGIPHKLIGVNSADKTVTIDNKDYMPTTFFINASEIPVKPYLRSMSSMTEEEKEEYNSHLSGIITGIDAANFMIWVYKHHLDIFHFVKKGLALEAPEGMYK